MVNHCKDLQVLKPPPRAHHEIPDHFADGKFTRLRPILPLGEGEQSH